MLNKIKSSLSRNITNARGWHTDRKIIVIESDDWGSIRIPNKNSIEILNGKGFKIEQCAYMQNDSLESNEDLEILFNLLSTRKKRTVITANILTANPDFSKIKDANFNTYHYETVDQTVKHYPGRENVISLWKEGLNNKIFIPQLHGREHLNIDNWMHDLQNGNKETLEAFDLNIFGVSASVVKQPRRSYQAAFGLSNGNKTINYKKILEEAHKQFKDILGYDSKTFIAPNYTWNQDIEDVLHNLGVSHFQGMSAQRVPNYSKEILNIKRNYLGKTNNNKQKYLIRNAIFEPFSQPNKDWVSSCLKEIENSFFWKKPAIITMHRVNFIGSINSKNRDWNLALFSKLLNEIDKKWPDAEYLSSNELAKIV